MFLKLFSTFPPLFQLFCQDYQIVMSGQFRTLGMFTIVLSIVVSFRRRQASEQKILPHFLHLNIIDYTKSDPVLTLNKI